MRKSAIFHKSGGVIAYGTAVNNPNEYPPPHGLEDDAVAVVIHETDRELTEDRNDHDTFHALIHECEYKNGKLHRKGKPLKAVCVEKLRMKNGALEDNTVHGWRRRAIFEPEVDDNGEEIEGPDGMPEGQWYRMGPFGHKKNKYGNPEPNLIPIEKPSSHDRHVWKGTQGNELELDLKADMDLFDEAVSWEEDFIE